MRQQRNKKRRNKKKEKTPTKEGQNVKKLRRRPTQRRENHLVVFTTLQDAHSSAEALAWRANAQRELKLIFLLSCRPQGDAHGSTTPLLLLSLSFSYSCYGGVEGGVGSWMEGGGVAWVGIKNDGGCCGCCCCCRRLHGLTVYMFRLTGVT